MGENCRIYCLFLGGRLHTKKWWHSFFVCNEPPFNSITGLWVSSKSSWLITRADSERLSDNARSSSSSSLLLLSIMLLSLFFIKPECYLHVVSYKECIYHVTQWRAIIEIEAQINNSSVLNHCSRVATEQQIVEWCGLMRLESPDETREETISLQNLK